MVWSFEGKSLWMMVVLFIGHTMAAIADEGAKENSFFSRNGISLIFKILIWIGHQFHILFLKKKKITYSLITFIYLFIEI